MDERYVEDFNPHPALKLDTTEKSTRYSVPYFHASL